MRGRARALASQHRHRLRDRRGSGAAVPRVRVRPRRDAAREHRRPRDQPAPRRRLRGSDRGRARRSALAGHRPRRSQARQRHRHAEGQRQDSRLRPGSLDGRRRRARPCRPRDDGDCPAGWGDRAYGALHVAGAGARRGSRLAHRHLLAGRRAVRDADWPRPVSGIAATEVTEEAVHGPLAAPTTLNKSLPPEVDAIVERMLAKSPGERYQSAATVAAELRSVGSVARRTRSERRLRPPPAPPTRSSSMRLARGRRDPGRPRGAHLVRHAGVNLKVGQGADLVGPLYCPLARISAAAR